MTEETENRFRPFAYLRGANLHGTNLRGANLHCAALLGADLRGADLREADLTGADLREAILYMVNLHGANLCGANLYGANLRSANLYCANLRGANGVVSFGPVGAAGRIGYVVASANGPKVQLGCFWGTADEAREAIEIRYGANSAYWRLVAAAIEVLNEQKGEAP